MGIINDLIDTNNNELENDQNTNTETNDNESSNSSDNSNDSIKYIKQMAIVFSLFILMAGCNGKDVAGPENVITDQEISESEIVELPSDNAVEDIADIPDIPSNDSSEETDPEIISNTEFNYDDVDTTSAAKSVHSDFTKVEYLSNLSQVTKNSISYLFLNNNKITDISNLWEFPNLTLLRLENNYLESLDGLYNRKKNYHLISDSFYYYTSSVKLKFGV